MYKKIHAKPIKRSDMRLWLGAKYFTLKRHFYWFFSKYDFADRYVLKKCEKSAFEFFIPTDLCRQRRRHGKNYAHPFFVCHSHKTPLYRKLKDVDMYMQENKVHNLKIAVLMVNNIVIKPGQIFSYWRVIGKPTKRKGYKKGMVLKSGKVTAAIGGGLCQLSNLIYWLTIHTQLTVVERHRHGYDVFPDTNRTQPFGSGATCFYNYGDLVIKNDTQHTFQLSINVGEEFLEGAWMCDTKPDFTYEVYEKDHIMQSNFWGGYTRHNVIHRKKMDIYGEVVADEYVIENNAIMMYAPFLEGASK